MEPSVARSASLGRMGNLAVDLLAGLQSATSEAPKPDGFDQQYRNDLEESGIIFASRGINWEQHVEMMPPPSQSQSQSQMVNDEVAEVFDDRELEMQGSIHSTLTSKTHKVRQLKRQEFEMHLDFEEANPFKMLKEKHDEILALDDGPNKTTSKHVYNCIGTLFKASRKNQELRKFLAELFGATEKYYGFKEKKKELKRQIKLFEKLRNDHELADFQAKQLKRSREEDEEMVNKARK